jgi:HEAT repeat protein
MTRAAVVMIGAALALASGCGSGDPAEATVRSIIDDLGAQRFGRATARYRQAEDVVLSVAAAPAWRRGLEHDDSTVREWSVDALARIGEPLDVARIVTALDDPFRNVQEVAASGLVALDPAAARDAFIERLGSGDAMKQTIAAQGLADLRDVAAVSPLIDRLEDDATEGAVRVIIAQSLAALGDGRAIAPLAAVAGDPDVDVRLRRNAAEGLATFESDEATRALRDLLQSDDSYVQEVARRAIAVRR